MRKASCFFIIFLALLFVFTLYSCENLLISDWWKSQEESPLPSPEPEPEAEEPEPLPPIPLGAVAYREVGSDIVFYTSLKSAIEAAPESQSAPDFITLIEDISLGATDSAEFYSWMAKKRIVLTTRMGAKKSITPTGQLVLGHDSDADASNLVLMGGTGGGEITIKGNVKLNPRCTFVLYSGVSIAAPYTITLSGIAKINLGEAISYPSGTLMTIVPSSYTDTTKVLKSYEAENCQKFEVADQAVIPKTWVIDSDGELATFGISGGDGLTTFEISSPPGRVLDLDSIIATDPSAQFKLMSDISINKPVTGTFEGTLDGNGKTVKMTIDESPASGHLGMFEKISSGAVVKNMTVEGSLSGSGTRIGAVAGYNDGGTIQNIHSAVDITATTTATVPANGDGFSCVGGIVGSSHKKDNAGGVIINCYSTGAISITDNFTGRLYVGGVVGSSVGVSYSYSTSQITLLDSILDSTVANPHPADYIHIGGISGSGTPTCSVALNPSISSNVSIPEFTTYNPIRRLCEMSGGSNSYGKTEMLISNGGTLVTPSNVGLSGKDGADVSTGDYNTQGWWTTGANWAGNPWRFSPAPPTPPPENGPWVWDEARLLPKFHWE